MENMPVIKGATLLTTGEVGEYLSVSSPVSKFRKFDDSWWVRSKAWWNRYYDHSGEAACVTNDGEIAQAGTMIECAVRPALIIEDGNVGDIFEFNGVRFVVISKDRALCVDDIGYCAFRKDMGAEDASDYDKSDVKAYIDNWYSGAGITEAVDNKHDAMIVTKDGKYYPMSKYEANKWINDHGIKDFHCADAKGIKYFYIDEPTAIQESLFEETDPNSELFDLAYDINEVYEDYDRYGYYDAFNDVDEGLDTIEDGLLHNPEDIIEWLEEIVQDQQDSIDMYPNDAWYYNGWKSKFSSLLDRARKLTGGIMTESLDTMSVGDLMYGYTDNMPDEQIDSEITLMSRIGKYLGVKNYDDVRVFVDADNEYDPQWFEFVDEVDYKPKDKFIKYATKDRLKLAKDVMNGHTFLYFKDDDDFERYTDMVNKYNNPVDESLELQTEDVVKKSNGKWTNRGKDGEEHGEFDTKKQAMAQMKAMYANGYKGESLELKTEDAEEKEKNARCFLGKKSVKESYGDESYTVRSYYGVNYSGLEDSLETEDWSEVEDFAHDKLMSGHYVEITGLGMDERLDPDEYIEYIETFDGEFPIKPLSHVWADVMSNPRTRRYFEPTTYESLELKTEGTYHRVKPQYDNTELLDLKTNSNKGDILVGNELYTQKELDRLKSRYRLRGKTSWDDALELVDEKPSDTYKMFGARFGSKGYAHESKKPVQEEIGLELKVEEEEPTEAEKTISDCVLKNINEDNALDMKFEFVSFKNENDCYTIDIVSKDKVYYYTATTIAESKEVDDYIESLTSNLKKQIEVDALTGNAEVIDENTPKPVDLTESKILMEDGIDTLISDLETAFYDKAKSAEWGFSTDEEVKNYLDPHIESKPVTDNDEFNYSIEVRFEPPTYNAQRDMGEALDKVLKDHGHNEAYFDDVTYGIMETYIKI